MTLTVDEVRNIRFPMARQPNEDGYRASAVDNFIDRLEVSYAQIVDENQRLKSSGGGGNDDAVRRQLDAVTRERDDLARQKADLSGRLAAAPDPNTAAALHARVDELTRANQDLQARLTAVPAVDPGATAALQSRVDDLTRANQDLQSRLMAVPAVDPGATAALQSRIDDLTRTNQDLQSRLSVLPTDAPEKLARAAEENSSLRAQSALLESQIRDLQTKLAAQATAEAGPIEGDTRQIVVTTSAEAAPAVVLLVEQTLQQVQGLMDNAKTEIDQHRADAEIEARRLVESATRQAEELSRRAQTDADMVQSDATAAADRLISEARARSAAIDNEATDKHQQLLGKLEHDRDQLSERIGQLRDFESQYRASMSGHLQRQLDSLRETEFAPSYRPELLDANAKPRPMAGGSL